MKTTDVSKDNFYDTKNDGNDNKRKKVELDVKVVNKSVIIPLLSLVFIDNSIATVSQTQV